MARTAPAAAPRAPRLLRAALLLLLLLLVAAGRRAAGAPVVGELRCQCLNTVQVQRIHARNLQSVRVTLPGPHCDRTEVIATLRNAQEACLNPADPRVKKIIDKILNQGSSN